VWRKCLEKREAIFQSFQQDTLDRPLMNWSTLSLDLSHLSPDNLITHELRFELTEEIQPTRTIDQFRICNRVCCAGNPVGEADLIAHLSRNHGQRRVKQAGYLPEEIAEQVLLGGLYTRSILIALPTSLPSLCRDGWATARAVCRSRWKICQAESA